MVTKKVFQVTIFEKNGKVRTNPLLANEFHLAKTILNDPETLRIEIDVRTIEAETQTALENKIALMF